MRDKNAKRYRKDNYVISIEQLIEWISELDLAQPSESIEKVKGQIDDILTSLEV